MPFKLLQKYISMCLPEVVQGSNILSEHSCRIRLGALGSPAAFFERTMTACRLRNQKEAVTHGAVLL